MSARPGFVTPMKAVLTDERPGGPDWVFERKLDGIRCLAVKDGGRTRLYSRNELSLDERYASLAAAPRGSGTDLGALLVGHFDGDRLRYAGKVGTGFTRATLRELASRLAPLVRETSPFEPVKGIPRAATWVQPELVAQIAFMEWTPDGRLRHPSFLGLRIDKPAREVVREEP